MESFFEEADTPDGEQAVLIDYGDITLELHADNTHIREYREGDGAYNHVFHVPGGSFEGAVMFAAEPEVIELLGEVGVVTVIHEALDDVAIDFMRTQIVGSFETLLSDE